MAQGKLKVRAKLPSGVKKRSPVARKTKGHVKKGTRYIAPKKKQNLDKEKVRKGLEQAINARIEEEVTQRASSAGQTFKVMRGESSSRPTRGGRKKQKSK